MTADGEAKYFVATRTDGLGERLRAIVNAIILADHFGTPFKFIWPVRPLKAQQHHAIISADETFEADFLAEHLVSDIHPANYPLVGGELRSEEDIRNVLASSAGGLSVSQQPLERILDVPELSDLKGKYLAAFRRIRFTAKAQAAIDKAMTVKLPRKNVVAVHLRAGDTFTATSVFPVR